MEGLDPVLKVCLFVFLVCALLYMARIERYLREVSASARRIADALDRATPKPVPGAPPGPGAPTAGQKPPDER